MTENLPLFDRYFTLEEAAGMVGEVRLALESAQKELAELRDEAVLSKRLYLARQQAGKHAAEPALVESEGIVLQAKVEDYQEAYETWVRYFMDKGIVVRDLERGLIDFPYKASNGEEFLLCWLYGEEGLFYFHDPYEGFGGRKPITLLPD